MAGRNVTVPFLFMITVPSFLVGHVTDIIFSVLPSESILLSDIFPTTGLFAIAISQSSLAIAGLFVLIVDTICFSAF